MKKQEAIHQLIKARESLETEKIKKIHEVWKIESKLEEILGHLEKLGCKMIIELEEFNKEHEKRAKGATDTDPQ